jgi:hypothetical protein
MLKKNTLFRRTVPVNEKKTIHDRFGRLAGEKVYLYLAKKPTSAANL